MIKRIARALKEPQRIVMGAIWRGYLNWLPDKPYLKLMYWASLGKRLDLIHPTTFNEKLQWMKINDRRLEYVRMVDKHEVKEYVAGIIGQSYLIPTLGVWSTFDEINFDTLPNQFVLKCTHDSSSLVICRDKNSLNKEEARRKIMKSLKRNYYYVGREWPYKNVNRRIIAEQYMEDSSDKELKNYKFFCFDGEPELLYLSQCRNDNEMFIDFVTLDWKKAQFARSDFPSFKELPPKPKNFDQMVDLTKKLSKGYPFLRVDLYEINGELYFSELTHFPTSGFIPFSNADDDRQLGALLKLPIA